MEAITDQQLNLLHHDFIEVFINKNPNFILNINTYKCKNCGIFIYQHVWLPRTEERIEINSTDCCDNILIKNIIK